MYYFYVVGCPCGILVLCIYCNGPKIVDKCRKKKEKERVANNSDSDRAEVDHKQKKISKYRNH